LLSLSLFALRNVDKENGVFMDGQRITKEGKKEGKMETRFLDETRGSVPGEVGVLLEKYDFVVWGIGPCRHTHSKRTARSAAKSVARDSRTATAELVAAGVGTGADVCD